MIFTALYENSHIGTLCREARVVLINSGYGIPSCCGHHAVPRAFRFGLDWFAVQEFKQPQHPRKVRTILALKALRPKGVACNPTSNPSGWRQVIKPLPGGSLS